MKLEQLTPAALEALKACIATRGAHKGKFKASAPPSGTAAHAAWQGAMLVFNPYKASIMALCLMSPEHAAIMREIEQWAEANKALRFLDRDRAALEIMGAW